MKRQKYEKILASLDGEQCKDESDDYKFEFSVLSNSAIDLVEIDFIDDLVELKQNPDEDKVIRIFQAFFLILD